MTHFQWRIYFIVQTTGMGPVQILQQLVHYLQPSDGDGKTNSSTVTFYRRKKETIQSHYST